MSHKAQQHFFDKLKKEFPEFFSNKKILEIGSYNVNGSIRPLFSNCEYIGIDLAPGKDVDIVCPGHLFVPKDNVQFDFVVSTECFEHNDKWLETLKNMISICKKDGLIAITCASRHRKTHGTQRRNPKSSLSSMFSNYYKNLNLKDFVSSLDFDSIFRVYSFTVNNNDLYFYGIKY